MINIEKLKAVRQLMVDHKENFYWGDWLISTNEDRLEAPKAEELLHNCGTIGCIAGFCCALADKNNQILTNAKIFLEIDGMFTSLIESILFIPEIIFGFKDGFNSDLDIEFQNALERIDFVIWLYEKDLLSQIVKDFNNENYSVDYYSNWKADVQSKV